MIHSSTRLPILQMLHKLSKKHWQFLLYWAALVTLSVRLTSLFIRGLNAVSVSAAQHQWAHSGQEFAVAGLVNVCNYRRPEEEERELVALAQEDVGEDDGYSSTYMQGAAYILSKVRHF